MSCTELLLLPTALADIIRVHHRATVVPPTPQRHPPEPDPTPTSSASLPSRPSSWPHSRRFRIQYYEVDILRHLNHAAYFRFMETLRTEYYLPLIGTTDPSLFDIIIAEACCRYLAPVAYDDELLGEVAPARPVGRNHFTLLYRFWDRQQKRWTARGRTVVVTFDYERKEKKPIEPAVRTALESDAIDPAAEGW